ncbi:IS1380 family transposase [Candidatus Palauibacter sp.]|uniref:IS1380 family transposase n=1 Tax=Candidatus Palauibacter sp. TaxID=3101350 RepID=UPI003B5AA886
MSHGQSRGNSARRKRKVKARHCKAGRRRARAKPVFSAGGLHYEIGARTSAMSYGGIGAVRRLVSKLGLAREMDRRLELLRRHLPYHESDHVLNIAYNLLCGGTRLEDLGGLRHDAAYMDALGAELIPSPTAAGDFTRRFSESDVIELMECINAVRPKLWRGRGRDLLGPVAYVDVDGTLAPTLGKKKAGMDQSYKGVWGYHPLVVSLANTGEVLYLVNRPGNAVSHRGAAAWIDKALALVSPHVPRVCVRGDTDFSLTVNFDRWSEQADFIFGYDAQPPALVARAEALEADAWTRLGREPRHVSPTGATRSKREDVKGRIVRERGYVNKRLNFEDVAEYDYRPAKCRKTYRMVVVRKNISRMKGELTLVEEIRYFFYITTRRDPGAAEVVRLANARSDQENVIEQLKNGVNALRVPVYDLVSNWAYMVMAALAWNLKSFLAMMMHLKADRRRYVAMEFRRFVREMILVPCQVIRRARQTTLRIIGWQPTTDRLFSVWRTIERTGFG